MRIARQAASHQQQQCEDNDHSDSSDFQARYRTKAGTLVRVLWNSAQVGHSCCSPPQRGDGKAGSRLQNVGVVSSRYRHMGNLMSEDLR
jgi:hypothetical protein